MLFSRAAAVTKTRDRSSSHVLWIGTDRDPFVFALSSCNGVRHRTRVLSRLSSDNWEQYEYLKECGEDI